MNWQSFKLKIIFFILALVFLCFFFDAQKANASQCTAASPNMTCQTAPAYGGLGCNQSGLLDESQLSCGWSGQVCCSYADCRYGTGYDSYFTNKNTGTTWGTAFELVWKSNGSVISGTGGWHFAYVSNTANWYDYYYDFGWLPNVGYNKAGIKWYTACVDPTTYPSCAPGYCSNYTCGMGIEPDVTCYPTGGLPKYMCTGGANNLGTLGWNAVCPTCPSGSCCIGGDYQSCSSPWCTSGTCTLNQFSSCNYSSGRTGFNWCRYTSTANNYSVCGGAAVSGTSMCSGSSYTCSPPAPTVSLTTSCNGAIPQITATRTSNVLHSNGIYDIRWRVSGGSFTNICATSTNPYTVTGLTQSTSYEVQVRGHTTSGWNGPTAFSSDTITTPNCGYTISGNVYIDANNNSIKDAGDSNATGITMTLSNGTTNPTDGSGNYSFTAVPAGSYIVSLPSSVAGYYIPIRTSPSITVPPNQSYNFRLVPQSTVNIVVFNDYNGNGVLDGVDSPSSGQTVTVTGGGAQTYTTNGVTKTVSGLNPGSSTITVSGLQSGWKLTTTNPVTVSYPPPTSQTVNFGVQPPPPNCVGGAKGITANPTTVNPGKTSALSISCSSPTGSPLTYTWYDDPGIAGDLVTNTNTNTSTWTAPTPYWTLNTANPTVQVCYTGTTVCTNSGLSNGIVPSPNPNTLPPGILIVPLFSVSGNVFVDQNKDSLQNGGDINYTGTITLVPSAGAITYPQPAGSYLVSNLPGGTYTITYTSLPARYQMTYPKNGPPPSFTITVGNASTSSPCTTNANLNASCDANGNITALKYGITNSLPWIQAISGDITGNNVSNPSGGGFSDPVPQGATCGTYVSLVGAGSTPGIIFSGASSYDFGWGQASQDPYNWVVGGLTYPDTYAPITPGIIKTSYSYITSIANASGITPTDISSYCGAGGINNCTLSTTLPNGVYISNGDLNLNGASYTFPANKNFVILVSGVLNINTEVHVPVGSTATFTTSGDINVAETIGESSSSSTRANVEGYYSADKRFYVRGVNSCPTTDLRLNVAGAIVVNAALANTGATGGFVNERDLCAADLQCPAFSVIERPDFIINAPDFFKTTRRVWREIAP